MRSEPELVEELRRHLPGSYGTVDLGRLTTWRTGGQARSVTVGSGSQLARVLEICSRFERPWFVLGLGSNILAADGGCDELVIRLGAGMKSHTWSRDEASHVLVCGAGAHLPSLSGAACTRGAAGLEFAVGIPGTLGGAVFMNAGAYGTSISELVSSVTFMDGEGSMHTVPGNLCGFDYRRSRFQDGQAVISSVELRLRNGDRRELRSEARRILALRREKFPLEHPNAGSVFRKPAEGIPPGKLIEDAGLKGRTLGGAMVSPRHANFIVNTGGATSSDIRSLIEVVRETVHRTSGIMLEEEIRYLGWGTDDRPL